jgi:hypothetical protein
MNFEEYFDNDTIQIENTIMASDLSKIDTAMPSTIHIIPVRYKPIFPGIITRLLLQSPGLCTQLMIIKHSGLLVSCTKRYDVEDVD